LPLAELAERLAEAHPTDRAQIDLASYRGLVAPWNDWNYLVGCGRRWAGVVAGAALESAQ